MPFFNMMGRVVSPPHFRKQNTLGGKVPTLQSCALVYTFVPQKPGQADDIAVLQFSSRIKGLL